MFASYLGLSTLILTWFAALTGQTVIQDGADDDNDGIHLAVHPTCGTFGGNFTDANAGVNLTRMQTIVSFGVSTPRNLTLFF